MSKTDSNEPIYKTLLTPKGIGDFPGVPGVYLEVADNYSSTRLIGPPICDELIALVQHMFTEEEASVVRHLKPFGAKTAKAVARAEHRPVEEMREILERLANDKSILLSFGSPGKKRYIIMPIVPGTFEWVMLFPTEANLSEWHRRFAELFEELFESNYHVDYFKKFHDKNGYPPVRYLPVGQTIESHPMALPTDRLEENLDIYDQFAVGICQCRTTKKITGEGCGKPLEVCSAFGPTAEKVIQRGKMRRVEKKELLEIKAEAEANGLITWMMNIDEKSAKIGNASCSCCECCCPMLQTITKFNLPGMIAPPHFMPVFDQNRCSYCGKCAKTCQLSAIIVDKKDKTHIHQSKNCIGCGQCVLACRENNALRMEPVQKYKKPPKGWPGGITKMLPGLSRIAWSIWRDK